MKMVDAFTSGLKLYLNPFKRHFKMLSGRHFVNKDTLHVHYTYYMYLSQNRKASRVASKRMAFVIRC